MRNFAKYILRAAWFLFCGLVASSACHEIWRVNVHPGDYVYLWGAEGPVAGVWYYASETAYLIHETIVLLWFLCGAAFCLPRFNRPVPLKIHFILSILWLAALYSVFAYDI